MSSSRAALPQQAYNDFCGEYPVLKTGFLLLRIQARWLFKRALKVRVE
jgi:hypothetical protein